MLTLNSVMIGSSKPKVMAEFYTRVLGKPADWAEDTWSVWQLGSAYLMIGKHSEVKGKAKDPPRLIINFEAKQVKKECDRIRDLGAKVVKELYEMEGHRIGTFADPDGNYFQVISPWKEDR